MENNKTDFGAMIGVIIVIIILIVGAFYFAGQRIEKSKEFQANINREVISTTSTSTLSDDISDIEKDANSMNFDDLGSGINGL